MHGAKVKIRTSCLKAIVLKSVTQEVMNLGMILKFDKINVLYINRYNNGPLIVV
jgi:hypothetical protein